MTVLPAISLPAEDIYLLAVLGSNRISHPKLPSLSALPAHRGHLALHAADQPPDPKRLTTGASWLGWEASPGLAMGRDRRCTPRMILRPDTPGKRKWAARMGRSVFAVDLDTLPRGAVVAVAVLTGERRASRGADAVWFLDKLVTLSKPVPVDTEDWPLYQPWTVEPPADDAIRRSWKASMRQTRRRRA